MTTTEGSADWLFDRPVYSVKRVAEISGRSEATVRQHVRDGRLPSLKLGDKLIRIKGCDAQQWYVLANDISKPKRRKKSVDELHRKIISIVRCYPFDGGFVYFIKSGKYVKIGYSASPDFRLSDLNNSCANPTELKLLGSIKASKKAERGLHLEFKDIRHRREWFILTSDLARAIALIGIRHTTDTYPPKDAPKYDMSDFVPCTRAKS